MTARTVAPWIEYTLGAGVAVSLLIGVGFLLYVALVHRRR